MSLSDDFEYLAEAVARLIGLLEEADEGFWLPYLKRSLRDIKAHRLAGATSVLGCYGGQDTLSDLVVGAGRHDANTPDYRNLNARLSELRSEVFQRADRITSRRSW